MPHKRIRWIKKHISTETIYTEIAAPLHCGVEQSMVVLVVLVVGEAEGWSGNA